MLAVIVEEVGNEEVKESFTSYVKKVPLSDTPTLRGVELLKWNFTRGSLWKTSKKLMLFLPLWMNQLT